MKDYREFVVKRLRFLDDLIVTTERALKTAPPGRLVVRQKQGRCSYFLTDRERGIVEKYLGGADTDMIMRLAQKAYDLKVYEEAQKERKALLSYVRRLGLSDGAVKGLLHDASDTDIAVGMLPERVFAQMPNGIRELIVVPMRLASDELFVSEWLKYEYSGPSIQGDPPMFKTECGELVRSKSELIIANTLHSFNVPYRYECPLDLGGGDIVYPDFEPLNVRLRKVFYWEHFGLLSDPNYLERSVRKISRYEAAGYYPGDRLLITRETASFPLSTESVEAIIRKYLL